MWREGTIGVPGENGNSVIHYWVKHYQNGSIFGIAGGRISKLEMRQDGRCVCRYDRGWDMKAATPEAKFALRVLLHDFN